MALIHGGKQKQCKEISQVILDITKDYQVNSYCEPFAGMISVFGEVYNHYEDSINYKFGDLNLSTIFMWKKAQKGWYPPTKCSKSTYEYYRTARPSAEKGYFCHTYAFMGQFCEKYACDYGKPEDSTKGSQRVHNLGKKARGACFSHGDYKQFSKLKNSIIYCDPPYENSSQRYLTEGMFNSKEFWCWVRTMAEDNLLFVSSYNAPKDFKCIWSKAHKLTGQQKNNKNKERVEKLFVYNI